MSLASLISPHLPVLTVLLPAFTAMLLVLIGDSRERVVLARRIALASVTVGLLLALKLALDAHGGELRVYRVGD
jgi:multicomponent K+:H+ antiporter subunit D